ncbi:MAG: hypothetical protein KJ994_01960, partial [Candidatus Omnitrophica bacterium]|nr:hypothetical protein [Candidatus Omnitrophota bacterium]
GPDPSNANDPLGNKSVGFLFGYTLSRIKDGWEETEGLKDRMSRIRELKPKYEFYNGIKFDENAPESDISAYIGGLLSLDRFLQEELKDGQPGHENAMQQLEKHLQYRKRVREKMDALRAKPAKGLTAPQIVSQAEKLKVADLEAYIAIELKKKSRAYGRPITPVEEARVRKEATAIFGGMYRSGEISVIADEFIVDNKYAPLPPQKIVNINDVEIILDLRRLVDELVDQGVVAVASKGIEYDMEKARYVDKRVEQLQAKAKKANVTFSKYEIDNYREKCGENFSGIYRQGVVNSRVKSFYERKIKDAGKIEAILRASDVVDKAAKANWRQLTAGEVDNWINVLMERAYLDRAERNLEVARKEKLIDERLAKSDIKEWRAVEGRVKEAAQAIADIFKLIRFEQDGQIIAVDLTKKYLVKSEQERLTDEAAITDLSKALNQAGVFNGRIKELMEIIKGARFKSWKSIRAEVENVERAKDRFLMEADFTKKPGLLKKAIEAATELNKEYKGGFKVVEAIKDPALRKELIKIFSELPALIDNAGRADREEFKKAEPNKMSLDLVDGLLKRIDLIIETMADARKAELKSIGKDKDGKEIPGYRRELNDVIAKKEKELRETFDKKEAAESEFKRNYAGKIWQRVSGWWTLRDLNKNRKNLDELQRTMLRARLLYNLDLYREKLADEKATSEAQRLYEELDAQVRAESPDPDSGLPGPELVHKRIARIKELLKGRQKTALGEMVNGAYLNSVFRTNGSELQVGEMGFIQTRITLGTDIRLAKERYVERLKKQGMSEAECKEAGEWYIRNLIAKNIRHEALINDLQEKLIKSFLAKNPDEVTRLTKGQMVGRYESLMGKNLSSEEEAAEIKSWFADATLIQGWAKEYLGYYLGNPMLENAINTMRKDFGLPVLYNNKDRARANFINTYVGQTVAYKNIGADLEAEKNDLWNERTVFGALESSRSAVLQRGLGKIVLDKLGESVKARGETVETLSGFHNELLYMLSKSAYDWEQADYLKGNLGDEASVRTRIQNDIVALDRLVLPLIVENMAIMTDNGKGGSERGMAGRNELWVKKNRAQLDNWIAEQKDKKDARRSKAINYATQVKSKNDTPAELARAVSQIKDYMEKFKKEIEDEITVVNATLPAGKKIDPADSELIWYFQKVMLASGMTAEDILQEAYKKPEEIREVYRELGIPINEAAEAKIKYYVMKMDLDGWTPDYIKTQLAYSDYIRNQMNKILAKTESGPKELTDLQAEILANHMIVNGIMPVNPEDIGIDMKGSKEKIVSDLADKTDLPVNRVINLTLKIYIDLIQKRYKVDIKGILYTLGLTLDTNLVEPPKVSEIKLTDEAKKKEAEVVRGQLLRVGFGASADLKEKAGVDKIIKGIVNNMNERNIHPSALVMLIDTVIDIRNRITKELAREGDYTSDDIAQRENMKLTRSAFEMLVFFDQDKLDRNKIIGIAEIPEIGMDLNSPAYKLLALNVKASVDAYWAGLIKSHIEGEYKVLRTAAKERVQRIYGKGLSGDMLGRAADQIIAKNLLRLQHIEVDGKVTEKVVEAGFETASPEVINAEITAKIKAIVENLLREEKALKWGDPISFLRSMALVGAVFAALGFR